MLNFHYEGKRIERGNAYLKSLMLKWVMNYLKNPEAYDLKDYCIDILLNHLTVAEVISIYNTCLELKEYALNKRSTDPIEVNNAIKDGDYNELIEFLSEFWRKSVVRSIEDLIYSLIESQIGAQRDIIENDEMIARLNTLGQTFNLSESELTALMFFYMIGVNSDFSNITTAGTRFDKILKKTLEQFTLLTKTSRLLSKKVFSRSSPLRKYELIDNAWELNDQIIDYLNGFSEKPLVNRMFTQYTGDSLPLSAHTIRSNDTDLIRRIIQNRGKDEGVNILLYGVPGTGKTEYCHSLSASMNLNLYEITSEKDDGSEQSGFSRYTACDICQNCIQNDNSIVLIDEADEMLNGGDGNGVLAFLDGSVRNTEKHKINELLDKATTVNFWITNYYGNIDESTRRRFDYSIEFKKLDYKQRVDVWSSSLNKHMLNDCFSDTQITGFAKKYKINAGGIDIVLKNYKKIPEDQRNEATLKSFIVPHQKLMGLDGGTSNLFPVKRYSLNGLNIRGEQSIMDGLEIMREFSGFMKRDEYKESEIKNMNLLLYGPPGSGKTEFVKYMAREIGRELLIKRGSDFLGMYVGQTEMNINKAFQMAMDDGSVLFIDEADGLFFDRGKSKQRFEMTQVNELLTQIENFKGILVCATNFHDNMDSATFRRFNLKYEFDYLNDEGKLMFYKSQLEEMAPQPLKENEESSLLELDNLTPGAFKVVSHKYAFFKNRKLTHEFLINALRDEVAHSRKSEKRRIGFLNSNGINV